MVKKTYLAVFFIAILIPSVTFAGSIQLPQTGQSICYDTSGAVITCSGTGQDGDLRAGVAWPNPRFKDNGDQTMLDNLTGLVWAKDGNIMETLNPSFDNDSLAGDGLVTWQHALDYIKRLNSGNYLGHKDWRLPNVIELESLINAGHPNSAYWLISQGFLNVSEVYDYWSSNTYAGITQYAWTVYMPSGNVSHPGKYGYHYVWPVRSGQFGPLSSSIISLPRTGQTKCYNASGGMISCAGTGQDGEFQMGVPWPNLRFADNGDQTLRDELTGLIWMNDFTVSGPATCGPISSKTWQGALDYVKCLNTNNYMGHNDWRVPNFKELWSLINFEQPEAYDWLNLQGFNNPPPVYYWSSSTNEFRFQQIFALNVYNGNVIDYTKTNSTPVWPVRSAPLKGDINGDKSVDLADMILALQSLSRMNPMGIRSDYLSSGVDINDDEKIGLQDVIYILQKVARIR